MAEPPVARPPGGGDSRARRAARFPWLRTFLTVIVVIVLPAVVGYIWFSAVQTDAFERRDRQLLEDLWGENKAPWKVW